MFLLLFHLLFLCGDCLANTSGFRVHPFEVNPVTGHARPGHATDTHSCEHVSAVPDELRSAEYMYPNGLDPFYQKYTEAYGIPVLGSASVSDNALRRACYTVRFMFADNWQVRDAYYSNSGRHALMSVDEVTRDIPEHAFLPAYWDTRARGLEPTESIPVCTGAEENALCLTEDKYSDEDITLHELAHALHMLAANYALPNFNLRVRTQYLKAVHAGLWKDTYALTDEREYLAEGIQSYLGVNAFADPPDGIHNHVDTREELLAYDPGLYSLIVELFSCNNTYIPRCDRDRDAEQKQKLTLNCAGKRPVQR